MTETLKNWAANLEYTAKDIQRPETVEEAQEVVARSQKLKPLGTRHSFSSVADTPGTLLSTEHLNRIVALDEQNRTVTVEGGIRYGELGRFLDSKGFALQNLASLPHISVAGACATATHGSGVDNGNLATAVVALDLITSSGAIRNLNKEADPESFNGSVVSLGALGLAARLTLKIVPAFQVSQTVYEKLPFAALEHHFNEITASAYSVSLFTFWNSDDIDQIWVKSTNPPNSTPDRFGAAKATVPHSPLPDGDVQNCTDQLGVPGPSYDRLPHFRMGFTPSSGEELQTEYFVPRENAWAALSAINSIRSQVARLLHTTEVRCIAADDLWLSPNYQRNSVAIHFTWKKQWEEVQALLPTIEKLLEPFSARPHWGKLYTMPADKLQPLYPKLPEFKKLMASLDPEGKFQNPFLTQFS